MSKRNSMKEAMLINKMRKEDPVELPMDDAFFDQMHSKIMQSVAKTEVKKLSKWSKTWVFLEKKTHKPRAAMKKTAKLGIAATVLTLGANLFTQAVGIVSQVDMQMSLDKNQSVIISEAQKNPMEWTSLAAHYQNESDFYAEVLSQRDLETMVEIDRIIDQSL